MIVGGWSWDGGTGADACTTGKVMVLSEGIQNVDNTFTIHNGRFVIFRCEDVY